VLNDPGLADDSRFCTNSLRSAHRDALTALIERAFAAATAPDVLARLDAAQIACARLNDVLDFWNHPQHRARGRRHTIDSPAGPVEALAPPIDLEGVAPRMGAIPAVGEHTRAVLAEVGLNDAEIAALETAGVISVRTGAT
jgi:itaconate CoA-transferase